MTEISAVPAWNPIYREKASGARADRPELLRMIDELQPGEVVVAERIDRINMAWYLGVFHGVP